MASKIVEFGRTVDAAAVKIADKQSDAVAYIWTVESAALTRAFPIVKIFYGKQSKPVAYFRCRSIADREATIRRHFESRRARSAMHKKLADERKAFRHAYKVGSVFRCSWGYDQTNVDYYECVRLIGATKLVVRKIASKSVETSSMVGVCTPLPGQFISEEKTYKATQSGFRVASYAFANYVAPQMVGGVPTYGVDHWTAYA